MGLGDVCTKTRVLIAVVVAIIVLIVGLAIGFTAEKNHAQKNLTAEKYHAQTNLTAEKNHAKTNLTAEKNHTPKKLPFAKEKWELPANYKARRPKGIGLYKDMLYLSPDDVEIGHARKCVSCPITWTVYLLNKAEEIAVIVKQKAWSWKVQYDIEEQWKTNSTSYKLEYSWGGSSISKEVYIIMNKDGEEIARTDRFRLEFDTTITLRDSNDNKVLGVAKRPAFQWFPTWEITVYNKDVLPTYFYAAIATVTTLKEAEDKK